MKTNKSTSSQEDGSRPNAKKVKFVDLPKRAFLNSSSQMVTWKPKFSGTGMEFLYSMS